MRPVLKQIGETSKAASLIGIATPLAGAAIVPVVSVLSLQDGFKEKNKKLIVGGAIGLISAPVTVPVGFIGGLLASPFTAAVEGVSAHDDSRSYVGDLEDSDDDVVDTEPSKK